VRGLTERGQLSEPLKPQPGEEEAEVMAGGDKDQADGVAGGVRQVVPTPCGSRL